MGEPILPPDDPQPKRYGSRTAWIRRALPDDPADQVLFLFERIERVYSLFIMRDLGRLYGAMRAVRPSPTVLRQWHKEINQARSTASITGMMLYELWTGVAQLKRRGHGTKKKAEADAWLRRQLGTLEPPR